jgi:UDPglucose--hexose-1-phosphate uridylyltransferase
VSGRWVIIAAERGRRPSDFAFERLAVAATGGEPCPFCEGHEALTPPEVLARRASGVPDSPGWNIRIVPNKFPALQLSGELVRQTGGMFERMPGIGTHEVVIDTPEHGRTFATMTGAEIAQVLAACQERVRMLKADPRLRYVIVFKNHGAQAGATREHSHGQLIALPIVPDFVREEVDGAAEYFSGTNRCVFCDMLREERGGARAILEEGLVAVIAPYASRSPFETWLIPRRHDAAFEDAPEAVVNDMAAAIRTVLERVNRTLNEPPYNLIVHSAPFGGGCAESFHWHVELMPRLSRTAGFEWGTGFYINPTAPETAAEILRDGGGAGI